MSCASLLDVGVFSSFTATYNLAVDSLLLRNVGRSVITYDIAELVCQALDKSMTTSNIKVGFQKPGIYPYGRDAFHKDEFITHIKEKYEKVGAIFPPPQLDKSTESQENLSHSTASTSPIPTNSESNQSSSFNDLTLSEKETSKSFVGPSHIFGLPDLTSSVNAPTSIGKQ